MKVCLYANALHYGRTYDLFRRPALWGHLRLSLSTIEPNANSADGD